MHTRLASASPDSGEMTSTGSSRRSSASVSVASLSRALCRLRIDASCCSWRSALCSGERQPSHVCSRLERRSLGPAEPTEGPGSDGELDGVRHLCTQRSNGEGVSPWAAPAMGPFALVSLFCTLHAHRKFGQHRGLRRRTTQLLDNTFKRPLGNGPAKRPTTQTWYGSMAHMAHPNQNRPNAQSACARAKSSSAHMTW